MLKAKKGFSLRKVGEQFVIVPVGEGTKIMRGIINVNETGAFIFKSLITGSSFDELVSDYMIEYEIEKELAVSDVTSVINILRKHNMLEEDD